MKRVLPITYGRYYFIKELDKSRVPSFVRSMGLGFSPMFFEKEDSWGSLVFGRSLRKLREFGGYMEHLGGVKGLGGSLVEPASPYMRKRGAGLWRGL